MEKVSPENYNTIKDSDYIVVEWRNSGRTVVMEYSKGSFISAKLGMDSNTWTDRWQEFSKARYCTRANKVAGATTFRFENYREMVTWLAKEKNGR